MPTRRSIIAGAGALAVLGRDADAQTARKLLLSGGAVAVPSGFNRWNPPFKLFKVGSVYSTNFNINSYIPPIAKTYYVNTVTGNGANPGTSGSPLSAVSTALGKSDVDQILIQNAGTVAANGAYIMWGNRGFSSTTPSRSVSVGPADGVSRFIMVANNGINTAPTWTKTAGLTNTYQCAAVAGASVNGPTDLKYLDGNGDFVKPVPATSSANVDTIPNSYYYDGSAILYVQATDSRNMVGDLYMTSITTAVNGCFNTAAALTLWVKNIDFVGGAPFNAVQPSAPLGAFPIICMYKCTFQGSQNIIDGYETNGGYTSFLQQCRSSNNYDDGYGYHALNGVSPNSFEYNCTTGFNGWSNSSDQASSAHDSANIITLNPNFAGAANVTIEDIISANRWILGGTLHPPVETDFNGNTIYVEGNAKMWVDGTTVLPATTTTLDVSGTLYYRNTPLNMLTIIGTGQLLPY